jgi:secondary thiamine-phosphate synthase enzyme
VETLEFTVTTGRESTVVDLTQNAEKFCSGKGDGLISVFIPHATAGVAIVEVGAGSDRDLMTAIDELLPAAPNRWKHEHGTPGHGRDHVLPAFISPSVTVPVVDGRIALGTWQSIVLVDTNVDNPDRRVRFTFISG